jgi:magnesium transporter
MDITEMPDTLTAPEAGAIEIDVVEYVEGKSVPRGWDDFLAARDQPDRQFQVEISSTHPGLLRDTLCAIYPDPLVVENFLNPQKSSGTRDDLGAVIMQFPVTTDWKSTDYTKLTLMCYANALIVINPTGQARLHRGASRAPAAPEKHVQQVEWRLYSILKDAIEQASDYALQARVSVDRLESDILEFAEEEELGFRLLNLKRAAAHLEMGLEAKHRAVSELLALDTSIVKLQQIRKPLLDLVARLGHSLRYAERIEDHLAELDRHLMYKLQEKTNNRLKILTIISAIFMPLTLIAGIYGMNFSFMPELNWHWGYPASLLLMLAVAAALIGYFYRKDWFK